MMVVLVGIVIGMGVCARVEGVTPIGEGLVLGAEEGTTYRIVIAEEPGLGVEAAAEELARFLSEIAGCGFAIVDDSGERTEDEILVGRSRAVEALGLEVDWDALGAEGYVIRTVGRRLVIAGGPGRGTINGVYGLLEEVLGCRWYSPAFSVIPRRSPLAIGALDVTCRPAFESRCIHCASDTDPGWSARNRLNTFTRDVGAAVQADGTPVDWDTFINDPRLAGAYHYARWHVHTLGHDGLLPYAAFDEHPEYFALRDGKRMQTAQPCMTNPELAAYIARRAKEWIASDPSARIMSISQGDFGNACQCERCQSAYKDGGVTAVYMRFVNDVAAEIEKDYPEILVDTLAYQWTRKLPAGIKMRRNVVIRYCPIEMCHHGTYDECGYNAAQRFGEDLREWCGAAPRVWVWYYAIPRTELHPYANLNSLSRNFRLMRDYGVKGFFIQAEEGRVCMSGGLTELQAFLFAKLLWDADYDVAKGIEEFAGACYGAGAPEIVRYVETVNNADSYTGTPAEYTHMLAYPGFHLGCMANVPLKKEVLAELDRLFDEAEEAVADDAGSLGRVRLVRLSVQYALMLYGDTDDRARERAIREFFPRAAAAGVPTVRNPKNGREESLEDFRKNFLER